MMSEYNMFRIECINGLGKKMNTHFHNKGGGIIDHVWTNINNIKASLSEYETTSDHEYIKVEVLLGNIKNYDSIIRSIYRPTQTQTENKHLIMKFNQLIKVKLQPFKIKENINDIYDSFNKTIIDMFDKTFKKSNKNHNQNRGKQHIEIDNKLKFWLDVKKRIKNGAFKEQKNEDL